MEAANSTKANFLDMLFPPISSIFLSWLYTAIDHITCIHIACRIETASIDPGGTLSVAYREPGGTASTCRRVDFARASFGRCPISFRTSASVTGSMTVGIVSGGGRERDQCWADYLVSLATKSDKRESDTCLPKRSSTDASPPSFRIF